MTRCADLRHVTFDELDVPHVDGAPEVASPALVDATDLGYAVTLPSRRESPTALAWPGVTPPVRFPAEATPCHACAARRCRRR